MATPNSEIEISTIQDCDPDTTYAPKTHLKHWKSPRVRKKCRNLQDWYPKLYCVEYWMTNYPASVSNSSSLSRTFSKKKSGNHLILGQRNSNFDPGFGRLMLFQVLSRSNQRDLSDTPVHILIFMIWIARIFKDWSKTQKTKILVGGGEYGRSLHETNVPPPIS